MRFHIATLPGDGVGSEIISEGIKVLKAAEYLVSGFSLDFEKYEAGAGFYKRTGVIFPSDSYKACKSSHAIYLGAIGLPDVVEETGTEVQGKVIIRLRQELDLFAGVRPIKLYPGVQSAVADVNVVDFVIVRENVEGLFASFGGGSVVSGEVATDTMVITRKGTEKICEYAFQLALKRKGRVLDGKRVVTCVDKSNNFRSLAFFRRVFNNVADRYQDQVQRDYAYIDAMALWTVMQPTHYDVLVAENMFGDILSDLAAALIGGMGMAPSGDIGYDHGLFQPAHGSAPLIAGKGIVNPVAAILSGSMMLDWLGNQHQIQPAKVASSMIEQAVSDVLKQGIKTVDIGGQTSTAKFGDAVIHEMMEIAKKKSF